jgi:predicted dehydrogenase
MRVGILSFAHVHAEGFTGNLRAIPGVELVGFSDDDGARGRRYSEALGLRHHPRHEDLIAEGVEAVVVCAENARRRELVEMAAAAGVHVLCEKPIEATLADAEAMRDACEAAGVTFMTAFPMRFDASVRSVKGALDRGELGALYAVNGINHSEFPGAHRAWFADRDLAGGGAVMDHTVHLTDLLRWMTGSEVVEVYAEVGNPFRPDEVDVDTAGLVTLTFANGVFAAVDCSWSRPASYPRWGHLKMELIGERGGLSVDAFSQALTGYGRSLPRNPTWIGWGADPNQAMVEAFLAAAAEGRDPPVTWRDGYEALRVALACYASAEAGQPVTLERDGTGGRPLT